MDFHFDKKSSSLPPFIAAAKFSGKRVGYYFRVGEMGLGYYVDHVQSISPDVSDEPKTKRVRMNDFQAKAKEFQVDVESVLENADAMQLLDADNLQVLVSNFEKKVLKNQKMRMKYADQPNKFMESELELHAGISELFAIAAFPELYQKFIDCNGLDIILGLISHENSDISLGIVGLLQELIDPEVILQESNIIESEDVEGDEKINIAMCIVHAFIAKQGLPLIVQNLFRLNEFESEDDAAGVHNTLNILENLLEILPTNMTILMVSKCKILEYLLMRLDTKDFDANKLYCSEILSLLLHGVDTRNSLKLTHLKVNGGSGLEILMKLCNNCRKVTSTQPEDLECIQNIFICLSSVLCHQSILKEFERLDGLELLCKVMSECKYASLCALKCLPYAVTENLINCQKFVSIGGLRYLFPVVMGHSIWKPSSDNKTLKKMAAEEKAGMVKASISVVHELMIFALSSKCEEALASRIITKFTENEFEKVDRLAELIVHYISSLMSYETTLRNHRLELLEKEDELELEDLDDPEVLFARRLSAGLLPLQHVCVITCALLSWLFQHDQKSVADKIILKFNSKLTPNKISFGVVLETVREMVARMQIIDPEDVNVAEIEDIVNEYEDAMLVDEQQHQVRVQERRDLYLKWCALVSSQVEV